MCAICVLGNISLKKNGYFSVNNMQLCIHLYRHSHERTLYETAINNCGARAQYCRVVEIIIAAQHVAADYRKIGLLNWARRASRY